METQELEQSAKSIAKKEYGSFLQDRIVSVKPVESNGKWGGLLVKGQEMKKDPFLLNKAKRSYQVPLRDYTLGGGIKPILEDQRKILIKKYEEKFPLGLTEKEFFEQELGIDLNHTSIENNFWRTNRLSRVELTKEGTQLNLNISIDMLKYKILLANKNKIAPSFEEREKRASYEFMIVDENKVVSQKAAEGRIKAQAYAKFNEIISTPASARGFIKSLGRAIPATATEDWIQQQIQDYMETNPKRFLDEINHPHYQGRIFVQNATEIGAIIRKADKRYMLENGAELGDMVDVVNYLADPENSDTKLRIKAQIETANRK